MNNKRLIIGLLFSVLLVLIPIVSAQGAWDTLDESLNSFGKALLNDRAEAAAEAVNPGKIWVPVLVLFFLVFSIISAALNFVPMFKEEQGRRMRIIIGLVFGLSAIQFPFIYAIIPWFGLWIWILLIFIIVALFFIGWGGFSTAWTKGAGEAASAKAEKYRAVEAEKKAEVAMTKEERERRIQRTEFRAEDKQLRGLRREFARQNQIGKSIGAKLQYALNLLQRIRAAGAGRKESPELNQALQKVIDVGIKEILPTVKQSLLNGRKLLAKTRKLEDLEIVGQMVEKHGDEFEGEFEKLAIEQLGKKPGKGGAEAKLTEAEKKNLDILCKKLRNMETRRKLLLDQIDPLENALMASNQKLVKAVEAIISKLEVANIDAAIVEINNALQLDKSDYGIISTLEAIAGEYQEMTTEEAEELLKIHENEELLKKTLQKTVKRIHVPAHPKS